MRSRDFGRLIIPGNEAVVDAIVNYGEFSGHEIVLDIGVGDGVLAKEISSHVKLIIGMDISEHMLRAGLRSGNWKDNIIPIIGDVRKAHFLEKTFDCIIASYLLHHTKGYTENIVQECYKILKWGGSLIIVFPVPPHDDLKEEFATIFSFKDDRIVLLPHEILELVRNAKFRSIQYDFLRITIDVIDWLNNSALDPNSYKKILNLHLNASKLFKEAYNMRVDKNRAMIDTKAIVIKGLKW